MHAYQIKTDPDPFEPFLIAQGYRVGGLIFLSGQASIDDAGTIIGPHDFAAQVDRTFKNIEEILTRTGSSLARIVKVTIYLTDMGRFPDIIEMRRRYFTPPYPADTIVEVKSLALPELMIEIDVIALVDGEIVPAAG
jgi:reactive intermediate/imine deaminase